MSAADRAASFRRQGVGKRALTALAGPLADLTFGVLVLSAVIAVISDPSATSGAPWLLHAILDPLWRGTAAAWRLSVAIVHTLRQIGAGWQSVQTLMGPLRTAQFSGTLASRGILALTAFIGIFSVNLGMTDLLPIPTLDGGHLLLFGGEAIRGRPLYPRTQVFAMRSVLAVIIALTVFTTWNDLPYLVSF